MKIGAPLQANPRNSYHRPYFSKGRFPSLFLRIKSKISKILFEIKNKLPVVLEKLHLNSRNKYLTASQRRKKLYFRTYFASILLVLLAGGFFVMVIVFALFSRNLPNPNQLLERTYELSTRFYDKNGDLLYEVYGDKNRTLVKLEDVSPDVVHATLSAEDSEFYLHKGYSLRGIIRAFISIVTHEGLQGGSTLTQQAIKNSLLTQDRTITRKIKELILSLQLENRYTKDEIMQMYLNESPYGGLNYGIYSAAKAYFNKLPKDLTLSESAYLAGLTQSPTFYSQFGSNPEAGIERRNYVLYLMKERGWVASDGKRYYISEEEHNVAKDEVLKFDMEKVPIEAPHFVYYVKQYLVDILGSDAVETGGLKVTTTLDLKTQRLAQDIVTTEVETNEKSLNMYNGAMVVLDPKTGGILAMVGSKGYNLESEPENCISGGTGENSCKFDPYVNITQSSRQPGSSIKPITYATLLSQGYTAAYTFLDVPTKFEGAAPDQPYIPVNYDGKFRGPMSLRKSLGNSLNIPAVKALKLAGIGNMIDQAEKMGITTFKDRTRFGLALTLGGGETKLLELTGAFAVFADKGIYKQPTPIIEVTDSKGKVIYKPSNTNKRVLSEENAFIISDILSDDGARSEAFGAGSLLNIWGKHVAVKTGTTDDKRDNYAIGFTPSVVAGVWVGNNNNEKMNPYVASGISGATPIYNKFMTAYLKDTPDEKFEASKTVKKMEVDKLTGGLSYKDYDKKNEWFAQNTEPTAVSDWYQRITTCEIDGRIANSGCIDADKEKTIDFIKIKAELPVWQSDVDAWVKENYNNDKKYFPPLMTSKLEFDGSSVTNKDEVFTQIVGIKDGEAVPLTFRLTAEVSCYNDVDKVSFYMDDKGMGDDSNSPYAKTIELKSSDIGTHRFKVVAKDKKGNKGEHEITLKVVGYSL